MGSALHYKVDFEGYYAHRRYKSYPMMLVWLGVLLGLRLCEIPMRWCVSVTEMVCYVYTTSVKYIQVLYHPCIPLRIQHLNYNGLFLLQKTIAKIAWDVSDKGCIDMIGMKITFIKLISINKSPVLVLLWRSLWRYLSIAEVVEDSHDFIPVMELVPWCNCLYRFFHYTLRKANVG